ncbi:MAG: orotidine-5'-phosphate decarboxylase [Thermoanaerobaculales bacterium]
MTSDALCVALDGSDREWILDTARAVAGSAGWLKIGLEAFIAHGPRLVEEVATLGPRVFLDLKLHDIPATVEGAAANCAACGAHMITVHASGGRTMLQAAASGVRKGRAGTPPKVVAVTVLTSLGKASLKDLGIAATPTDLVISWAALAMESGLDGVVASAREAPAIRRTCGREALIVTPGIRTATSDNDDQHRVLTPGEAIRAGSDILVVGRPITRAPDPAEATRRILEEMETG